MSAIRAWADARGVAVIEDACQVPGAYVDGRITGTWGDVGVLSFGGSKLLTAGRGGAVLTERDDVLQRIKVFCERGSNLVPLSELQAAVLAPQLAELENRNRRRLERARQLVDLCHGFAWLEPVAIAEGQIPAFYKLGMRYRPHSGANPPDRDRFTQAVRAEGVALDAGFRGFVRRTARRCRRVGDLAHSRQAAEQTVVLHHPVLLESGETMQRIAWALRKVIEGLDGRA
jgi:dTDP-4-amino-4,6-dideoxygalactose transaminase